MIKMLSYKNIELSLLEKDEIHTIVEETIKKSSRKIIFCVDFRFLKYFSNKGDVFSKGFILYPDSTGMYLTIKTLWRGKSEGFKKLVSTDIHYELLEVANRNNYTIYMFGSTEDILKKVHEIINNKYKGIKVLGSSNGYDFNEVDVINEINFLKPDILLVGMGVPKQEEWVLGNYSRLNSKVIITVGALFSFLSGTTDRAPKILRVLSLEWLFRFFQEPERLFKRYFYEFPAFYFAELIRVIKK